MGSWRVGPWCAWFCSNKFTSKCSSKNTAFHAVFVKYILGLLFLANGHRESCALKKQTKFQREPGCGHGQLLLKQAFQGFPNLSETTCCQLLMTSGLAAALQILGTGDFDRFYFLKNKSPKAYCRHSAVMGSASYKWFTHNVRGGEMSLIFPGTGSHP